MTGCGPATRDTDGPESGRREPDGQDPAAREPGGRAPSGQDADARERGKREPSGQHPSAREPGRRAPSGQDPAARDADAPDAGLDENVSGTAALAKLVVTLLAERGQTVAVAESLTGGLLAASLVEIPGASAVFRGGIVAYATDLKATLLGVPRALLDRHGAVHADVASAMAEGVRRRLDATFGVSTTGVAGPEPADGQPVGTVHIAASGNMAEVRLKLSCAGDRRAVRLQAVSSSLRLLRGMLADGSR